MAAVADDEEEEALLCSGETERGLPWFCWWWWWMCWSAWCEGWDGGVW